MLLFELEIPEFPNQIFLGNINSYFNFKEVNSKCLNFNKVFNAF